jgi:uncharacterized cupin superfamily protein
MSGGGTRVFATDEVPESNRTGYPGPLAAVSAKRWVRRLADHAGLSLFGVNLVRVEPGGQSSWRHAHSRQDELMIMQSGELVLLTDAGERVLRAGDVAGFPAGSGDAHCVVNRTDRDAVYLVIGDRTAGDEVTYPEVDLHATMGADGRYRFTRKDGSSY